MKGKVVSRIKRKEGEPLYLWVDRVADRMGLNDEQRQAMKEVSKQSYIVGVRSTLSSLSVVKAAPKQNEIHEN